MIAIVNRRVRTVFGGAIPPPAIGLKNRNNPRDDPPIINPSPSAGTRRKVRFDQRPLLIRQPNPGFMLLNLPYGYLSHEIIEALTSTDPGLDRFRTRADLWPEAHERFGEGRRFEGTQIIDAFPDPMA